MQILSWHFSGLGIALLIFTDDVILMAPLMCGLQHSLDQFVAECEAAGMIMFVYSLGLQYTTTYWN